MNIPTAFTQEKIIGVIRSDELMQAKEQFSSFVEAGIKIIEISLKNEASLQLIDWALKQNEEEQICIGAASILRAEQAQQAKELGVHFLVSPVCTKQVLTFAASNDLMFVPGASTPSEIAMAIDILNPPIIKLFPAPSLLAFQGLKKVFTGVDFMLSSYPVEDTKYYLKSGASYFAIGSHFTDQLSLTAERVNIVNEWCRLV
jgi:2-dehydro-3-deoxyphosphogluconate aldolase / (4S)-4-hydroxy-2-oxoglutarate aldolase